jgi:hypothetical protein
MDVRVATIDTMLSFYLAFIYTKEYEQFRTRIMCMAKFLFDVEQQNRLEQRGVLKRFSMNCIGKQPTLTDMKMEKSQMYHALKRGSAEYEKWFLKYTPTAEKLQANKPEKPQTLVPQPQPISLSQSRTKKYKRRAEHEPTYIIPISSFRKRLFTKRRNIIQ